jgi:heparinase II/III-like protein
VSIFGRLRTMDSAEVRFRLSCETRKIADRARMTVVRPGWQRANLTRLLVRDGGNGSENLTTAVGALERSDWNAAHRALAEHFVRREARFPLSPVQITSFVEQVRSRFPDSTNDVRERAERMLRGRYDILGYSDLFFGTPPDWYGDPVHNRTAARGFWSDIDYLDPRYGDHKITWEINRHQHWMSLGRAFQLTGDRRYYSAVIDQLEDWMSANAPLRGVNWASMLEIGFRSLSWIWTLHFFVTAATQDEARAPWIIDLLVGLDRQLEHVARNLSRYFSPNTHLSGEALSLYVAGQVLPELRNSAHWARLGRQILIDEAERQILADGGHAERSAHYHRYTTDFYLHALLVARLTNDPSAATFDRAARGVSNYLRDLTDDCGRLPLLGDDDGGQLFPICHRPPWDCRDTLAAAAVILGDPSLAVGEPPGEVFWLCGGAVPGTLSSRPSRRPSTSLSESGYSISRNPEGDHLIFDVGQHGYLNGGHAHADALSIVLTLRGQPLLVDPGTATYTMDPAMRNLFRSTAMHNTVMVNGRSQSEPRGAFHWRTTTNARAVVHHFENGFDYMEGRHTGYEHVVHTRAVACCHGLGWVIVDHLLGSEDATADGFWHIHPLWRPVQAERHVELQSPVLTTRLCCSESISFAENADHELALYSPVYGRIERGYCARIRTCGALPRSWMSFVDAGSPAPSGTCFTIESVAVDPPPGWHAAAFRLASAARDWLILSAVPLDDVSPAELPSQPWGCAELQTDARFVIADMSGATPPIRVGGTHALVVLSVH